MNNNMVRFNFLFILTAFLCVSCNFINSEETNEKKEALSSRLTATFDFNPTSTSNQIIVHDNYTLSYVEEYEQAEWVAYELKKEDIASCNFRRPFFIEDQKVKTGSANWRNYKQSGFDKGHLCPAGDRKFSKRAFDETFLTSNISPQKHDFNDGVWNRLEQKVRYWASKYDGVYVITAGVLEKRLATIGNEKVAVATNYMDIYKEYISKQATGMKVLGSVVQELRSGNISPDLDKCLVKYEDIAHHVDELKKKNRSVDPLLEKGIESYKNGQIIIFNGELFSYDQYKLSPHIMFIPFKDKLVFNINGLNNITKEEIMSSYFKLKEQY